MKHDRKLRTAEIRIGRAIRALLQKGLSPKEVAKLLELKETDLALWTQMADLDINS